jgi:acetyl-CoA synthetase
VSEFISSEVAWRPDDQTVARAQLTRFVRQCGLESFDDLHRRSIEDVGWFTAELLEFLEIQFDEPYAEIVDLSRGLAWPRWCVGGRMNITRSCLDRHLDTATAASPAVIWEGEEGAQRTLTYSELAREVERCAAGLRAIGLGRGDAIGLHLPMIPETAIALLAINRIGAIAVPLFSGYGPAAIESRLNDVEAKALFTCDAFPRRGSTVAAYQIADEAAVRCPALRHLIVVNRMGKKVELRDRRDVAWDHLLTEGERAGAGGQAEATAAEDLLIVLYTSGTTGRPKGIQHSHCGFPIKAAQDMAFGTDVGMQDRIAWVTDIGWMMGPWLIYGATLLGATMVLYDGAPDYPSPDRLWAFCAAHGINVLGISPTLVRALAAHGDEPVSRHNLSALRILGSTGEPWNPDPWRWLFEKVGRSRVPIINYSGGTEVSGGILMGNPLLPIKPCSFPAPCPGIAADVFDESGKVVRGAVGELVIRQPWIGQARGFWRDPERYLQTYFSRWPEVWVHGDWAAIDDDGHWYILGRSDDTLKIAGKRVGPAEVESILVAHPRVNEAAVVGIPDEKKGTAMIAFCIVAGAGDEKLASELRDRVGVELGKPLRPERIHFIEALPKTRNAKVMRRVIRAAYLGEDPGDLTALENPATLEIIRRHREGQREGQQDRQIDPH